MRPSASAIAIQAHLDEPRAGFLTIGYVPSEQAPPTENPPRFSWLPDIDDGARYVLRISTDPEFADAKTRTFEDLAWNFFTPDEALPVGSYHWCYALWDQYGGKPLSNWSAVRGFEITTALPETPLPGRTARHAAAHTSHPRLWLNPEQLKSFSGAVAKDPNHCGWSDFFEKSVKPWLDRPIMPEPQPYPNNVRVATLWRQMYIDCQEVIYAIRHLAIAGGVLGRDPSLIAIAQDLAALRRRMGPERGDGPRLQ
jgi:hypothetical protein